MACVACALKLLTAATSVFDRFTSACTFPGAWGPGEQVTERIKQGFEVAAVVHELGHEREAARDGFKRLLLGVRIERRERLRHIFDLRGKRDGLVAYLLALDDKIGC